MQRKIGYWCGTFNNFTIKYILSQIPSGGVVLHYLQMHKMFNIEFQ